MLLAASVPAAVAGCAGPMSLSDRDCMTRAMYFESNRSSEDGMVAVGTTVMNRLAAPGYPKTVCGVVGQRGQYAAGVLDKSMNPRESAAIAKVADDVLAGRRHPQVGDALFFHTAGMSFPYSNMHYVAEAGGNVFYEKREPGTFTNTIDPTLRAPAATAFAEQPPRFGERESSASAPAPRTLSQLIADALGFSDHHGRHRRHVARR